MLIAALPASAIALPTTDLGFKTAMWYKPNCPRHSTYKSWNDPAKLYIYLTGVATTVEEGTILGIVMEWLRETYEERKKKSLASNCTCDDDDDAANGSESRLPMGRDGAEHIIFFCHREGE